MVQWQTQVPLCLTGLSASTPACAAKQSFALGLLWLVGHIELELPGVPSWSWVAWVACFRLRSCGSGAEAVLQLVFDSRAEHAERCWPKLKKKVFLVRFFQGLIVWLPKIIQRAMLQEFRLRIFDQSCLKSSPEPYFRKFRFRGIFKNPSLRPSLEPLRQFRLQRIFKNPPRKFSAEPCFRNFCFKQSSTQHPLNGTVLAGEFSKNLGKMSNTAGRLGEDFSSMSSGNVSSFFWKVSLRTSLELA